jgi:vitamin B12 transporter
MKSAKTVIMMTCTLLLPLTVHAEGNEESLKAIEITATRTSVEDENPASALTVITQEEIKKKQHMQVKDILREQTGINVVNVGPMGGTTTVFMRGAGSQSTLVLIDGAQVNSNTTGSFDFSDMQMDNIERIEILRGPQSTLWGADAVGGVINIVTKRGQGEPRHFLSFEAGSYSTVKATLGSSGAVGKFDYTASVSRTDSDGFSAFNEDRGATENDGYENTTFSSRLGHHFLKDGRIELIGRYTKAKNAFDGFNFAPPGPVDAPNHLARRENFFIALPIEKSITPQWDARLSTNFSYDELDTKDPTFGDSVILSRTSSLDFQNNVSFGKYISAILGFEYQMTDGNNRTSNFSLENRSQGYYLQGNLNWQEQAFLTVGIRQDINSQFEDPFTYKVEGAYRINSWGTKLRGSVATGFRVPSVNEVLFPFFGNPNIQPEKSKNWEVGFEQKLFNNQVTLGSNFFHLDFEDLIVFDFVTFIAQNIGSATSKGIETFFNFQIQKNLELITNYTWNQATDNSDGSLLPRRPRHILSATLAHTWKNKLDSLVTVNHRSEMESGGGVVGERTVVRAALAYQLNKDWKLTARGENLFNEKYEESFQFGTAGISGYAGFVFSFN